MHQNIKKLDNYGPVFLYLVYLSSSSLESNATILARSAKCVKLDSRLEVT